MRDNLITRIQNDRELSPRERIFRQEDCKRLDRSPEATHRVLRKHKAEPPASSRDSCIYLSLQKALNALFQPPKLSSMFDALI